MSQLLITFCLIEPPPDAFICGVNGEITVEELQRIEKMFNEESGDDLPKGATSVTFSYEYEPGGYVGPHGEYQEAYWWPNEIVSIDGEEVRG